MPSGTTVGGLTPTWRSTGGVTGESLLVQRWATCTDKQPLTFTDTTTPTVILEKKKARGSDTQTVNMQTHAPTAPPLCGPKATSISFHLSTKNQNNAHAAL